MYVKVTQLKNGRWNWTIVARNGAFVARSPTTYARKWTAYRAIRKLVSYFDQKFDPERNKNREE